VFIPGLRPLNVRLICDADADDAGPMEPSVAGRANTAFMAAKLHFEAEMRMQGKAWNSWRQVDRASFTLVFQESSAMRH
jgi:hypothetical protein